MTNVYAVVKVNTEDVDDVDVLEVNKNMTQAIHTIFKDLKTDVSEEQGTAEIEQALDEDGYVLNSEIKETETGRERRVYKYFIRKSEVF